MKRFLADAILICILVSIGSYISHADPADTRAHIEQQVTDFEDEIAQKEVVKPKTEPVALNDIEDNGASKFAKKSSEIVIDTVKGTVGLFSNFFDTLTK